MSGLGFEVFGTVGSAIAVLEAIFWTKSYIHDFRHTKKQKEDLASQLNEFQDRIKDLRVSLQRQPPSSQATVLSMLNGIEVALNKIKEKVDDAKRIMWKFVKDEIKAMWVGLEQLKTFLMLVMVGKMSDGLEEHYDKAASRYDQISGEIKKFSAQQTQGFSDVLDAIETYTAPIQKRLDDVQNTIVSHTEKHLENVQNTIVSHTEKHMGDVQKAITSHTALAQKHVDVNRRRSIQEWLSSDSVTTESVRAELDELRKRRAKDSGVWLLNSDRMKSWFERSSEETIIIITGPPGCGKTMLSATVADFLEQRNETCIPVFIKYSSHMNSETVLRQLLAAAFPLLTAIPNALEECYTSKHIQGAQVLSVLKEAVLLLPDSAYIVLDGLDELEGSAQSLLDQLRSLIPNVKIFVTSRPSTVPEDFSPLTFNLETSDASDVTAFIKAEVSVITEALNSPVNEAEELIGLVTYASNNLFLLASLHISALREARRRVRVMDIAKTLQRTPDAYYLSTIARIRSRDPESCNAALASLFWVLQAKRPLTINELPAAVASVLDDLTGRAIEPSLFPIYELLRLCEGLLWLQDKTVGSHVNNTVRDFFQTVDDSVFGLIDSSGSSHIPCLGTACLRFLNAKHDPRHITKWTKQISKDQTSQPQDNFLRYCAHFWGAHLPFRPSTNILAQMARFEANTTVFNLAATHQMLSVLKGIDKSDVADNLDVTSMAHLAAVFNIGAYWGSNIRGAVDRRGLAGCTPLHCACILGHMSAVTKLVTLGAKATARSRKGNTPLHLAAQHGHLDVAKLLLSRDDVIVDSRNNDGKSPLWLACKYGHLDIALRLLSRGGVDPDARDNSDKSPLWVASENGHLKIVQLLLSRNVDTTRRDQTGKLPLWVACKSGNIVVVELLLSQDSVDADAMNNEGQSPLWIAAEYGHLEVMELLLSQYGVNADSRTKNGKSPLWMAAKYGHHNVVEFLLSQYSVDADSRSDKGKSPLWIAAKHGHLEIVQLLLSQDNVGPETQNHKGQSPFWIAAEYGHLDIIEFLLSRYSIDTDSRDHEGKSPLWIAAEYGHIHVVELLLSRYSVPVDFQDHEGRSPLWIASFYGHTKVVTLLLSQSDINADTRDKDGRTPLWCACMHGHLEIVQMLLSRQGVNADERDNEGQSLLSIASEYGHLDIVEKFLSRDDVDADSRNNDGRTPFAFASEYGHVEIVLLLLSQDNVNADSRDNFGDSPLSNACECDRPEVAQVLLFRDDLDVDLKNKEGRSPLWFACMYGRLEIVQTLLSRDGVDVDARDNKGHSPLSAAAEYGHLEIVELLLSHDDVAVDSQDDKGQTPLALAAEYGHIDVVLLLLSQKNVNANSRDKSGKTPLWVACEYNHSDVVVVLLSRNEVKADTRDNDGRSPLWIACQKGRINLVKLFLSRVDVDVDAEDNMGQSPLAVALDSNQAKVVEMLLSRDGVGMDERARVEKDQAAALQRYGHQPSSGKEVKKGGGNRTLKAIPFVGELFSLLEDSD